MRTTVYEVQLGTGDRFDIIGTQVDPSDAAFDAATFALNVARTGAEVHGHHVSHVERFAYRTWRLYRNGAPPLEVRVVERVDVGPRHWHIGSSVSSPGSECSACRELPAPSWVGP